MQLSTSWRLVGGLRSYDRRILITSAHIICHMENSRAAAGCSYWSWEFQGRAEGVTECVVAAEWRSERERNKERVSEEQVSEEQWLRVGKR